MKPLACQSGCDIPNNNKNHNCNFQLIGFLSGGESKEDKSWLLIAAKAPFSPDRGLHNFESLCPKKLSTDCVSCITKILSEKSIDNKTVKIMQDMENKKSEILLIPVNQMSRQVMIKNCPFLDKETFTSGKTGDFHLLKGLVSISQEQLEVLADLLTKSRDGQQQIGNKSIKEESSGKENEEKSKLLQIFNGKRCAINSDIFLKWITIRNCAKTGTVDYKCKGKVRETTSFPDSHVKDGIYRRNKNDVAAESNFMGTGSQIANYPEQLVKIELKPDRRIHEPALQCSSGDMLRFKVTMIQVADLQNGRDYQVEIDFVKSFRCKTMSHNSCRCRRITKVLQSTTLMENELKWGKGIHMSGQQFALSWISYQIPDFVDEGKAESRSGNLNEEKCDGESGSGRKLDNKFRVSDFEYNLQVRFYEKFTEDGQSESHHVLAACSSFPLGLMSTTKASVINGKESTLSQFITSDDISKALPVNICGEKEMGHHEPERFCRSIPIFRKSLSATEFDV